jgi:hypothetical protein
MALIDQSDVDEHLIRLVRHSVDYVRGQGQFEEWGVDRWYAIAIWRDDIQREFACPHNHRSQEAAERCSIKWQRALYLAAKRRPYAQRKSETGPGRPNKARLP